MLFLEIGLHLLRRHDPRAGGLHAVPVIEEVHTQIHLTIQIQAEQLFLGQLNDLAIVDYHSSSPPRKPASSAASRK